MLTTEEELPVQVRDIDGVQVDDFDGAKPGEDQILEKLTSDSTSTDDEDLQMDLTAQESV